MEDQQELLAEKDPDYRLQNLALVTALAARVEPEKNKNYGCFAIDETTKEMLHYAENTEVQISNLVNFGIYLFSVRIFSEYGLNPYPDDQ